MPVIVWVFFDRRLSVTQNRRKGAQTGTCTHDVSQFEWRLFIELGWTSELEEKFP